MLAKTQNSEIPLEVDQQHRLFAVIPASMKIRGGIRAGHEAKSYKGG
jgi:hypothetical protein